jgi:hypothetical protein
MLPPPPPVQPVCPLVRLNIFCVAEWKGSFNYWSQLLDAVTSADRVMSCRAICYAVSSASHWLQAEVHDLDLYLSQICIWTVTFFFSCGAGDQILLKPPILRVSGTYFIDYFVELLWWGIDPAQNLTQAHIKTHKTQAAEVSSRLLTPVSYEVYEFIYIYIYIY